MRSRALVTFVRRSAIFGLVAIIGFGAWALQHEPPDPFDRAEEFLAERVEEYLALRLKDDWVALYQMSNPEHRRRVSLSTFLATYGRGLLEVHEIRATSMSIDPVSRHAIVQLWSDVELIPERLPAKFQRGFRVPPKEFLRTEEEHSLQWKWQDGQWFFQIDREIVTGFDSAGNPIQVEPADQ